MTAFAALRDGVRRVTRAPAVLLGVWALTVVASLPLAFEMRTLIKTDLGSSLAGDRAAAGVDYDWMQEFASRTSGLGTTFTPAIIGFGAIVDNASAFLDNQPRPAVIAGVAAIYVLAWLFLAGGIIDRYARDRATGARRFCSTSTRFFLRFARLAVLMAVVYGLLFRYVHPWMFEHAYPVLTRGITVERTAFLIRLTLYAAFCTALAACNLLFDYAKVRAVIEDRRSMFGALLASQRFVIRNLAAATGLYLLDALILVSALAAYSMVAPGVGSTGWAMWLVFAIGQAYIVGRLWVKLIFWASETALFQGRLARAGYVATAAPIWRGSATRTTALPANEVGMTAAKPQSTMS